MGTFKIEGGHQLKGDIQPQGAKNEALQILCAVLLTSEKIIINKLFFDPILGFSFTVLLILFLFSFHTLLVGLIGEYIIRIYDEVKARPNYIIEDIKKKITNVQKNNL